MRSLFRRGIARTLPAAQLAGTWWELLAPPGEPGVPPAHARSLTLSPRPDGWLDLITRFRVGASSGPWQEQVSVARVATGHLGATLWLREGAFRWRERVIAARAADDEWMWLVAPTGGAAWLLARSPTLPGEVWPTALAAARAVGLELAELGLSPRMAAIVARPHGEAR